MKRNSIFLLALTFVSTTLSSNYIFSAEDVVVAVVNGKNITSSELEDYHRKNLSFVRAFKKVSVEASLNDLINKQLGIEKAKTAKIDKDPIVMQKLDEILYHAQISKDLEPELLKIKVSDSEVKKFYDENPEYDSAQILFRLTTEPTPNDVKAAIEKANEIYEEVIKDTESFEKFANKFSESNSAVTGGELGFQPRTRLTPEYYEAIKGKKNGHITKPFRSQYGIHVVKVLGVKDYDQINVDLYKKIIYDIKRDRILEDYFAGLRSKAKVKINKDALKDI